MSNFMVPNLLPTLINTARGHTIENSRHRNHMSDSAETPKEVALRLSNIAAINRIRFPKVWDEKQILQKCFSTLMLFKDDGKFDEEGAFNSLVETYGQEKENIIAENGDKKKRKVNPKEAPSGEDDDEKAKKAKLSDTFKCEDNRPVGEAILEIATAYFKNGDRMKGGVFSKGAKAIRECEIPITTKKEALALKGVGKGIAGYIEEFKETGGINKLEELRAGTA